MPPYNSNIEKDTLENKDFRRVVWTGAHMQVVLMNLNPGEEIGKETHPHVDQFFRVESGFGTAIVGEKDFNLADGSALVVPAGTEHNIINSGSDPLKLYTIYTPPNHIDGRIHKTKKDADADTEDENFGHRN